LPALAMRLSSGEGGEGVAKAASTDASSVTSTTQRMGFDIGLRELLDRSGVSGPRCVPHRYRRARRGEGAAMPSPMPPLPPVTITTRPDRSNGLGFGGVVTALTLRRRMAAGSDASPDSRTRSRSDWPRCANGCARRSTPASCVVPGGCGLGGEIVVARDVRQRHRTTRATDLQLHQGRRRRDDVATVRRGSCSPSIAWSPIWTGSGPTARTR